MRRTSRAILAVLLLTLGACGLTGDDKEAAESIATALQGEYAGLSSDDAGCVAEHWVKEIGLDSLQAADLVGENNTVTGNVRDVELSASDAGHALDGFTECTVFRDLVTGMVITLFEADEGQRSCIAEAVTDEVAEAWALSDLQGKVTDNVYVAAGRGCMSTDEEDARAVLALSGGLGARDGLTRAQARCVATGMVERIGTYELTAAGILTEDQELVDSLVGHSFNETDATLAADATTACVSLEELLSRSLVGGGSAGPGEAVKACFTEAFDADSFHHYLVQTYMGQRDNALDEEATAQLAGCLKDVVGQDQDAN